MPDEDPPRAFASELRAALDDAGRKQSWLGAEVARIEGLDTPIAQPARRRRPTGARRRITRGRRARACGRGGGS